MRPIAWNQRDVFRKAFLLAGVPEEGDEHPFIATMVAISDKGVIAFCATPGNIRVHGGVPRETVDPRIYSDQIFSELELPAFRLQPGFGGFCAVIGTVRIDSPPLGKLTLQIRFEEFVPLHEADAAYERRIADTVMSPAACAETNIPSLDVPLDSLRLATAGA